MTSTSPNAPTTSTPLAMRFALAVMVLVGLYDASIGLFMLASPEPWQAHGPGTLWRALDTDFATLAPGAQALVMSALRRIGAFSLFAGTLSVFVAIESRREPVRVLRFMVLYAVAGLGFAYTDGTYFAGTPYHVVKQVIGVLWVAALGALAWHLRGLRSAR